MPEIWKWIVEGEPGRADLVLLKAIEREKPFSRSALKRLFEEGCVRVSGKPIKPNSRLATGANVEIHFPEAKPSDVLPEQRDLEILFEDDHLLIINKPQGVSVHPSAAESSGTLVNALLHHVQSGKIGALSGIGGVLRPGIVHRIDKNTSGALVITKSDEVHRALGELFSRHAIERSYLALCYGSPKASEEQERGKVRARLRREQVHGPAGRRLQV